MTLQIPIPRPTYSPAREHLIKAVPPHLICSLVCGGKECRYEGPGDWSLQQQAIRGVFSAWVTEDILAMARPSTRLIEKFSIIKQFKGLNIKSVINLQVPGEHSYCGDPLELKSGFSYLPEVFMENDIYFFNFAMADFGVSSLVCILDAVKVTSFAVQEGRVAVHCHAGLGRTGVLIACYLVYATRVSPSEAVQFVRIKRPFSIQTRTQIDLVFDFAQFIDSQRTVFTGVSLHIPPITLQQYLYRQQHLLHGYEARQLKYVPKVVDYACKRLLQIVFNQQDRTAVQVEKQKEMSERIMTLDIRHTITSFMPFPEFQQPVDPDNVLRPLVGVAGSWTSSISTDRHTEIQLSKLSRSLSDSRLFRATRLDQAQDAIGQQSMSVGQKRTESFEQFFGRPLKCSASCEGRSNFADDKNQAQIDKAASLILPKRTNSLLSTGSLVKGKVHRNFSVKEHIRKADDHGSLLEMVARAMSEGPQIDDDLLTKVHLWQEPVLRSEDVMALLSKPTEKHHLQGLKKSQEGTINCILDCISKFTGLPSILEDRVIRRLILALTQSEEENMMHFAALSNKLKMTVREKRSHYLFSKGMVKTTTLVKISSHGKSK
ncbi:protein tyrosine phosphatase domain-containing protein 1 isoform X2 [Narcine bancroftii]|uniref:protein tyrosine phosphatase domain-containing protein 1 isoform X2 n=1 Tax=Narcine bancroftii TaxID=1343680 RepID=UPI0038320230